MISFKNTKLYKQSKLLDKNNNVTNIVSDIISLTSKNNNICCIPESIIELNNIECIDLSNNKIKDISFKSDSLKYLILNNNKITNLEFITNFKNLERLEIKNNLIRKFPKQKHYHLQDLILTDNLIKIIKNINYLKKIEYINIKNNKIVKSYYYTDYKLEIEYKDLLSLYKAFSYKDFLIMTNKFFNKELEKDLFILYLNNSDITKIQKYYFKYLNETNNIKYKYILSKTINNIIYNIEFK